MSEVESFAMDSQTRLGDLPCLQDQQIPQTIGDLSVTRLYPQYRDQHYKDGFGLETPRISDELFISLFVKNGVNTEILRRVLAHYGAWRTNNSIIDDTHGFKRGSSIGWHLDGPDNPVSKNPTTLINHPHKPASGPTYVGPNKEVVQFIADNIHHLSGWCISYLRRCLAHDIRTEAKRIQRQSLEYDVPNINSLLKKFGRLYAANLRWGKRKFMNEANITKGAYSILSHNWENDPNSLAFSNRVAIHSSDARADGYLQYAKP